MTTLGGALLTMTLLIAFADWVAVALDRRSIEYVLKPATMVALGAFVLALKLPSGEVRWWHLAAIACSLAGDVFLMLPASVMDEKLLVRGRLASFLVAHLLYIVGMAALGVSGGLLAVGAVAAAVLLGTVGLRVARGARSHDAALLRAGAGLHRSDRRHDRHILRHRHRSRHRWGAAVWAVRLGAGVNHLPGRLPTQPGGGDGDLSPGSGGPGARFACSVTPHLQASVGEASGRPSPPGAGGGQPGEMQPVAVGEATRRITWRTPPSHTT